jgi:hypothetical protein
MSPSLILKQDELGRVRVSTQRADELVAEFQRSGLTAVRFAAQVGVAYHTFWSWLKKRGLTGSRTPRSKPTELPAPAGCFVEVTLAVPEVGLVVQLPGGASVVVQRESQAGLVAALLKALNPVSLP